MNANKRLHDSALSQLLSLQPADPLWKRVPTHDASGARLSDFMMLIPGLKQHPAAVQHKTVIQLSNVLMSYEEIVVFADLNLRLNLLWVSIKPVMGMCLEIPAAIKVAVPEARLIAPKYQE